MSECEQCASLIAALEQALQQFRQRPSGEGLYTYAAKPVNQLIDSIEAALASPAPATGEPTRETP